MTWTPPLRVWVAPVPYSLCHEFSTPADPAAREYVPASRVEELEAGLRWILEYGTRDGDLLEGWEDAMRNIASSLLSGGSREDDA